MFLNVNTMARLFCLIALLFSMSHDAYPADDAESSKRHSDVITVGSVSLTIKEEINEFQPIADYLATHLKDAGIKKGRVIVTDTVEAMAEHMRRGDVDIYIDSPFPIATASRLSGAKPFLRRWKRGVAEYYTVIFVRKDSGIQSLKELKGKLVAFDEPSSTTGHLIPKAMLIKEGLYTTEILDPMDLPPPQEVCYIFTNDDDNTMFSVLKGRVQAGAMDNVHFSKLSGKKKDELKILATSIHIPRHVVAHRADISPELVAEIKEVLINMDKDPRGKEVLLDFQKTIKFDKFPQGPEEAFKPIFELIELVGIEQKE